MNDFFFTIPAALHRLRSAAAVVLLSGSAALAQAPAALSPADLQAQYPEGSIRSVEDADKALADVARVREAIKARYAQEEQACQPNFFVTSCVEKAKEKQRRDLWLLRPVELESNKFKRQTKVEQRDADLADKQEKAEEKRLEAERAAPPPPRTPKPPVTEKPGNPAEARTTADRVAEHEARMQALQEKEQAEAPKRAARAEAYERKVQASLKRQEEVARRKAEKEEKRRAKEQAGAAPSKPPVPRP